MKQIGAVLISAMMTMPVFGAFSKNDRGTAGAKFLKIGVGARAIAMGEAYTALSDEASGVYWNPAGLTRIERLSLTTMHTVWLSHFTQDYAGIVYPLKKHNQAIGIQATMMSHPGIKIISTGETAKPSDIAIGLSYGRTVGLLNVGMTLKSINQTLYTKTMTGYAADVGIMYRNVLDTWGCGLSAVNMGPAIDGDPLPMSLQLGSMLRIGRKLTLTADLHAPQDDVMSAHTGAEYILRVMRNVEASLCVGYQTTHLQELGVMAGVSCGMEVSWEDLRFQYALAPYGELGNTHRMSIGYSFGNNSGKRARAGYDFRIARKLYQQEKYSEAMELLKPYRKEPALCPEAARLSRLTDHKLRNIIDPDVLYNQACMFYKQKKFVHAYNLLTEALKYNKEHEKTKKLHEIVKKKVLLIQKKKKLETADKANNKKVASNLMQIGRQQMKEKKYDKAITTYEKLLKFDPNNSKAIELMLNAQEKLDGERKIK